MNCKNCIFWAKFRRIDKNGFADCDNDEKIDIEVEVDDDSGMSLRLITHENFGCVCFKQKAGEINGK